METTWRSQIVYAARTHLCKHTNWLREIPYKTGDSPAALHYPIGVRRVHVNSPNVEGTVFQIFWNYKQRSCIQFITNEQVKLIFFIWEGLDFTLGIRYVPLKHLIFNDKIIMQIKQRETEGRYFHQQLI